MNINRDVNEKRVDELIIEITKVLKVINSYSESLKNEYVDEFDRPTDVSLNPAYYEKLREVIKKDRAYVNQLYDELEKLTQANSFDLAKVFVDVAKKKFSEKYDSYQKHIGDVYYLCVGPKGYDKQYSDMIVKEEEIIIDANTKPLTKYDSRSFLLREKEFEVDGRKTTVELTTYLPGDLSRALESLKEPSKKVSSLNMKRFEM